MSGSKKTNGCACTQGLRDLLRARTPKEDSLIRIVCAGCDKVFRSNIDTEYCFDCEAKKEEISGEGLVDGE